MAPIAYELRADYAGTVTLEDGTELDKFQGGLINGGSREVNIGDELAAGGGTIVLADDEDPRLIAALDNYPALKRVAAHGAEPTLTSDSPPAPPEPVEDVELPDPDDADAGEED